MILIIQKMNFNSIKMKKINLSDQIDSFHNKEEKGLFTFYREISDPPHTQSNNEFVTHEENNQPNQLLRLIQKQNSKIPEIQNKRLVYKHQKPRQLINLTPQNILTHNFQKDIKKSQSFNSKTQPSEYFVQNKFAFNFMKQKDQKILEQFLLQRQTSDLLKNKSFGKCLINPQLSLKYGKFAPKNYTSSLRKDLKQPSHKLVNCKQQKSSIIKEIASGNQYRNNSQQQIINYDITPKQFLLKQKRNQPRFKSSFFPSASKRRPSKNENPSKNRNFYSQVQCIEEQKESCMNLKTQFQKSDQNQNYLNSLTVPQKLIKRKIRTLMNSLQKMQQNYHQSDIIDIFKQKKSNLLRKKENLNDKRFVNYTELKSRQPLLIMEKIQFMEDVYKSSNRLERKDTSNISPQPKRQRHQIQSSVKRNQGMVKKFLTQKVLLKIITNIKNRYETI